MKIKIKNISEFCKLYKINIPLKEEFDYYIDTLLKSPEYKTEIFEKQFKDFVQLEKFASDNNFESVGKLKMYCLDTLADYIKATNAYTTLIEKELPKKQLNTKDWTSTVTDGDLLMSIDFKSANYSVLKTFDKSGELKNSWRELCESLLIPEALIESKSFRQLVFGNTSPKRLQTFQHFNMTALKEELELFGESREELNFLTQDVNYIFVSHDEVVVKIPNKETAFQVEKLLLHFWSKFTMHTRLTYFSLKKIKKNLYIKTVFKLDTQNIIKKYDTLHGAPGNKFYMLFKEHILHEPFDDRDLIYINDDELCRWVVNKPKGLPHYPKPDIVLSIEEAQKTYPMVWDKMGELVPDLTNEEKRRIVEIIANTCKYCWSTQSRCHCMNDE